ncbi:MAG: hypothetical protein COB08_009690 [Rhodobacteraceae bacterium]|nr:hypothetical protein [Paracoccaceae bacterium]
MENETILRLGVFLGLFTLFGMLEFLFPRRARVQSQLKRWSTHWILLVIYSVLIRGMGLLTPVIVPRARPRMRRAMAGGCLTCSAFGVAGNSTLSDVSAYGSK